MLIFILHNLRGFYSHHIMQEISKFEEKINVIPYSLEKHIEIMIGKIIVFTDSMQFMKCN